MERAKCDKCPYLKIYYRGTENTPAFSERCGWAWTRPEEVKPEDCKREQEKRK